MINETETIDKLFLELSQVTTATTEKEMRMIRLLKIIIDEWDNPVRDPSLYERGKKLLSVYYK